MREVKTMGLVDAVVILVLAMLAMTVLWIKEYRTFAIVLAISVAAVLFCFSVVTGVAFVLFTALLAGYLKVIDWAQKTG